MKEHYHVILTVAEHDLCRLPIKFVTWNEAETYARRQVKAYCANGYRIEKW